MVKQQPLTPKQRAIVNFINKHYIQKGYAPSLEEIAKEFNLSAVSTVHQHIFLIRKKGYLQKDAFQPRGIAPLIETSKTVEIPLLGRVPAGRPIEPIENPEPIEVLSSLIKGSAKDYYALEVVGDSMIDDDVWDGDIILVKYQQTIPQIGEMIIAVSEGNVTLKRFGGDFGDQIKLIPRNPSMDPFFVDAETFEVRGKFAGLIRRAQNHF